MKLHCEPAFYHSKVGRRSESKPIQHDLNDFKVDGHDKNVIRSRIENHSEFASKFDNSDCVGKSVIFQGVGQKNSGLPCSLSNRETVQVQKISDKFYMDEGVRECELPELTICYQESSENVIKDICIDEGVPFNDKVLFETLAEESKIDKTSSHPEKEQMIEGAEGVANTSAYGPDRSKCFLDNINLDKESDDQCGSKYSMQLGNAEDRAEDYNSEKSGKEKDCSTDKTECGSIKDQTSPVNVTMSTKVSESSSDAHDGNKYREQCTQIPNYESNMGSFTSASKSEGPGNVVEATHQSCANAESDQTTPSNMLIYNQAAANGSSTSNCDISVPALNDEGKPPRNDLRELLEIENASRLEGGPSGRLLVSNRVENSNGETSFSMNGATSGRISCSESIPYSGSMSMRSESSTTSGRSFAFPIIQSEWNSSPVRMAKGDRRHIPKHRRWKDALLCCRF